MSGGGDNDVEDSAQTRNLAYVAASKWNFAQSKLKPLQELYMDRVDNFNSDQNQNYVRGMAMGGAQDFLGESTGAVMAGANQRGLDMDSGAVSAANTDAAISAAAAGGSTASKGEFELESQQLAGMQNIMAIGNGQQTRAQAGLSTLSNIAGQNARQDARNTFNRRSANLQTLGTVAGAAGAYYKDNPPDWWANRGLSEPSIDPARDTATGINQPDFSRVS